MNDFIFGAILGFVMTLVFFGILVEAGNSAQHERMKRCVDRGINALECYEISYSELK